MSALLKDQRVIDVLTTLSTLIDERKSQQETARKDVKNLPCIVCGSVGETTDNPAHYGIQRPMCRYHAAAWGSMYYKNITQGSYDSDELIELLFARFLINAIKRGR